MRGRLIAVCIAAALILAMPVRAAAASTDGDYYNIPFRPDRAYLCASATNITGQITSSGFSLKTYTSSWYPGTLSDGLGATSAKPYVYSEFMMVAPEGEYYIPAGSDVTLTYAPEYNNSAWSTGSPQSALQTMFVWVRTLYRTSDGTLTYDYTTDRLSWSAGNTLVVNIPHDEVTHNIVGVSLVLGRTYASTITITNYVSGSARPQYASSSDDLTIVYTPTETKGILRGILSGVTNIFNVITNVFNAILELPSKIMDGITSLFVPSSDDLSGIYDDFEALMSSKLGAIWEVFDIVFGIFEGLSTSAETSTITFPGISLDLAGATFDFGPYEVAIWPAGMEGIQDSVRLATTTVLVVLWLRGLLRKMSQFLSPDSGGGDE